MSHRRNRTAGSLRMIALAAALGLTAITLTQCRMLKDNVTGISMTAGTLSGRSHCTRGCNDAYAAAMRAEEARHRLALRACGCDRSCREAENRRNDKNEDKIQDARKDCKKSCYNEGGGNGGHGDR
jgi:hypothetical protein